MLSVLNDTYGITGSLASNEDGDRITGQYVWFHYSDQTHTLNKFRSGDPMGLGRNRAPIANFVPINRVNGVTWSPDFIMGKSLQYGDYAGPFVTLI